MPNRIRRMVSLIAVLVIAASCGSDGGTPRGGGRQPSDGAGGEVLTVVATTTILGDVVSNLVGADARVDVLLPIGADPHDYRVSSRQIALILEADLVVANGLGFEEGILDVLEAAEADGANVFEVAELLDPVRLGEGGGAWDPHIWMDPRRMAEGARLIAAELAALDGSVAWSERADSYSARLLEADEEITTILAVVPELDRKLVTNHAVFGYFATRYGFEISGTVIPSGTTLGDPSSAELAALVDKIREAGVAAIFVETTGPTALAEAVAAEAEGGIEVVELYTGSLGEPGSGAETLIGMLRINARRIAGALS